MPCAQLTHRLEKMLTIRLIAKDRFPAVAAIQDVVERSFEFNSRLAWHGPAMFDKRPPSGKIEILRLTPSAPCFCLLPAGASIYCATQKKNEGNCGQYNRYAKQCIP
jgi:hypothetical protein